jgi:hypothetical protein
MRGVFEILVRCLQKSEVQTIYADAGNQVSAKENAIAVLQKKVTRGVALAPKFCGTCAYVDTLTLDSKLHLS